MGVCVRVFFFMFFQSYGDRAAGVAPTPLPGSEVLDQDLPMYISKMHTHM